jgi:hypothetical protein
MELLACLFLVTTLFGGGIAFGFLSSDRLNIARKQRLDQQEAQVRAEMDALMRTQQLNTAFLAARRVMWDEAQRHRMSGYR